MSKALDNKGTYGVQCLLIDFSKAFDLMMPDTLAHKLSDMNVPPYIVRLVIDLLTKRQQCVKYQNSQSSTKPTRVGVPQGTIFGPFLWNVYVTDLGKNRQVVKYADDTTIIDNVSKANVTPPIRQAENDR